MAINDDREEGLSRRDLLRHVGLAGATLVIPLRLVMPEAAAGAVLDSDQSSAAASFQTLTLIEGELLDAIVARLIPSDGNGAGAREAKAAQYIDRALGGALAASRQTYTNGLVSLDRYARSSRGAAFVQLSPRDQDSVLIDVETGAATGFTQPTASAFFAMVRSHTWQGTFGDPFYGGNANFVGWDLLGYPGLRLAVTAEEQRLGAMLTPTHRSAYDHSMFVKATARADLGPPSLPGTSVPARDLRPSQWGRRSAGGTEVARGDGGRPAGTEVPRDGD